jgi:hypothetical protein
MVNRIRSSWSDRLSHGRTSRPVVRYTVGGLRAVPVEHECWYLLCRVSVFREEVLTVKWGTNEVH